MSFGPRGKSQRYLKCLPWRLGEIIAGLCFAQWSVRWDAAIWDSTHAGRLCSAYMFCVHNTYPVYVHIGALLWIL